MSNQLDYEINKELGECYLFMGDFDKAEEYYRKAAGDNAQSAAPYLGLATVAVQRSELDKALVLYQKAASVEETDKALCGIGLVYMEQGEHQKAFDHFARALDKSCENIVALNCLVREAYQLGCVDKVLPYLEASFTWAAARKPANIWKPCWAPTPPTPTPRNFLTPWLPRHGRKTGRSPNILPSPHDFPAPGGRRGREIISRGIHRRTAFPPRPTETGRSAEAVKTPDLSGVFYVPAAKPGH